MISCKKTLLQTALLAVAFSERAKVSCWVSKMYGVPYHEIGEHGELLLCDYVPNECDKVFYQAIGNLKKYHAEKKIEIVDDLTFLESDFYDMPDGVEIKTLLNDLPLRNDDSNTTRIVEANRWRELISSTCFFLQYLSYGGNLQHKYSVCGERPKSWKNAEKLMDRLNAIWHLM